MLTDISDNDFSVVPINWLLPQLLKGLVFGSNKSDGWYGIQSSDGGNNDDGSHGNGGNYNGDDDDDYDCHAECLFLKVLQKTEKKKSERNI